MPFADLLDCCATDDGSGAAVLAACAARCWLVRNAADVTHIHGREDAPATACMSLVSCLPALEHVALSLPGLPDGDHLNCLLEALAWCPWLTILRLAMVCEDVYNAPFPAAPAFLRLRSLSTLQLALAGTEPYVLAAVADALAPLTGLTELIFEAFQPAVLPAALGRLKGLRTLDFLGLRPCSLEAGCLDLPDLLSLEFRHCGFEDGQVLPGYTALQSLLRIDCAHCEGHNFFAGLLVLPQLLYMGLDLAHRPFRGGAHLELPRLPAAMGSSSSGLQHLDICGHGLTEFPLAVMQLVALRCLRADGNEFAELPAAITALSRLTELRLGRTECHASPVHLRVKLPLDVRALGDLSSFPRLRKLILHCCEVLVCESVVGVVRHASLQCFYFSASYPAPVCMPVVLQLSLALTRLGRGSVLKVESWDACVAFQQALQNVQVQAPH